MRASVEVLDAAMSGLVALDDTTPTLLSAEALATAPSVAREPSGAGAAGAAPNGSAA